MSESLMVFSSIAQNHRSRRDTDYLSPKNDTRKRLTRQALTLFTNPTKKKSEFGARVASI
jgi:hypothetical protein